MTDYMISGAVSYITLLVIEAFSFLILFLCYENENYVNKSIIMNKIFDKNQALDGENSSTNLCCILYCTNMERSIKNDNPKTQTRPEIKTAAEAKDALINTVPIVVIIMPAVGHQELKRTLV